MIGATSIATRPRCLTPGTFAEWVQPENGDTLWGIEAIALWLGLPFLDVRTMIEMSRLPTTKAGRAHTSTRTALAGYFLALERRSAPPAMTGRPALDLRPNRSLGLLSGQQAIAAHLGCTVGGVRHRRTHGLPVFWIGKTPFARAASLDVWVEHDSRETRSSRRLAAIMDRRRAAAPVDAIVGAEAMAERIGCSVRGVFNAVHRKRLRVTRLGRALVATEADLERYAEERAAVVAKRSGGGK